MTNKEKMELVMKLIKEVVENTQTREFEQISPKNAKISGIMSVFGEDMIARIEPMYNWVQDSDE